MLLLFWKALGLSVGEVGHIRWYHNTGYPPRYLCGAEFGLTIINPYLKLTDVFPECSFFMTPSKVISSCIFDASIIAGTMADGVYELSWNVVKQAQCPVMSPEDLSSHAYQSYTTLSGLPSNNIVAVDSLDSYLSILTSSGLYWKKSGTEDYLTCLTTDGRDVVITSGPTLYLAEKNQLRIKRGEPLDLVTWDETILYTDSEINKIFVNTYNGIDTIFVATTSGLDVRDGAEYVNYYNVISGTKNLLSVVVEHDSRFDWGHAFTASSGGVNVVNLKSGEVENFLEFDGLAVSAVGYKRLYSK
jgi:hypothetical protein